VLKSCLRTCTLSHFQPSLIFAGKSYWNTKVLPSDRSPVRVGTTFISGVPLGWLQSGRLQLPDYLLPATYYQLSTTSYHQPTRWHYQYHVYFVAFLNYYLLVLAFNRDRCYHLALCLQLIHPHSIQFTFGSQCIHNNHYKWCCNTAGKS
jgi:hypothetical protein